MDADVTGPGRGGAGPRHPGRLLRTVAFLTVVVGFAVIRQGPPPALPTDAPPEDFSAGRALRHVEAIARRPHPLGSAAEGPVRDYLIAELKGLGLEPEVQRPHYFREHPDDPAAPGSWADVQNIVARWRGTGPASRRALLLSAHYDSVPLGPGAGDDAAGVAAILEALRALKAGPPPERDLIILFTDGEEIGLYGADVFAQEHAWTADVGAAINLEGRGNSGASIMFETSERNGWLIEQMARALPHPMASSLTYDVYRLMPNDTDLTVYKKYGLAGWNFAFVGGLADYHSPADTPGRLDPRTLQHHGENVLAMARRLLRMDLDDVRREDVVYFSILQRYVATYPKDWVLPLLGLSAAMYAAVVALGAARGRVRPSEVVAGSATLLAALPAAVLAVGLLWSALRGPMIRAEVVVNRPDLAHGRGMMVSPHDRALLAGSAAVAALVAGAVFGWSGRRWSWEGLGLGALAWWLIAAAAASLALPGGSYAFVWPLLGVLAGQAVAFLLPRGHWIAPTAACLGAVPLLVLHVFIILGLFDGLNVRLAPQLMIPVVLVVGALVPAAAQAIGRGPSATPGAMNLR